MTNAQLKLYWKYIKDVMEFKHQLTYLASKRTIKCRKCGANDVNPCPVPDPITAPLPVVAEEIRKWFEKSNSFSAWTRKLMDMATEKGFKVGIFREMWLIVYCTPEQKIEAAMSVLNELETK